MNVEETSRFGSKKGRKLTSLTNIQKKELCKYKRNNPTKSYEEIGRKTNASVISGMKDLQCQIQRKRIASLKQPTLETFYKNWIIYYIYILKQFVLAHSMQIKSTFIIYYYDKSDTSLSRTQESAPTSPTYRVCLCIWGLIKSKTIYLLLATAILESNV